MQVIHKSHDAGDRQAQTLAGPANAPRRPPHESWMLMPHEQSLPAGHPRAKVSPGLSHEATERDRRQCQQAPEAPATDTYRPAPLRRRSPVAEGSEIVLTDLSMLAVTSPVAIFQRFAKGLIILFQSFSRN